MYLRNWIVCQILTGPLCCRRVHDEFHRVETRLAVWKKDYDGRGKSASGCTFEMMAGDPRSSTSYLPHSLDRRVNSNIFEAMSCFLFYFPNLFMPKGLHILIRHQNNIGGINLLTGVNTIYYLERVFQRLLIRDLNQTSFSAKNLDGLLGLLSAMMETGSSTAYFLRERLLQMKL